jgi:deazaflavin-dependent oxidoreductase (nitroreductase family)
MPRRYEFAYLTTVGRRTAREHTVELWFGVRGDSVYFLAGNGESADWVRNATANPRVTVRLGRRSLVGRARRAADPGEELAARRALAAKYEDWAQGKRLSGWARTALPLAVDLPAGSLAEVR